MLQTRRVVLAAALSLLPLAAAAPASAAVDPACPDGVAVVVDATALGGEVTIGCAGGAPATGTDALHDAGFTDTRDPSGFICAIDEQPDPCPEEFTGEYWSYWYVADGTWVSYAEGSDTAVPGVAEGWAWGDGSIPPDADPATLVADDAATTATETAESSAEATAEAATESASEEPTMTEATTEVAAQDDAGGPGWTGIALGGLAIAVVLVTVLAVISRRRGSD